MEAKSAPVAQANTPAEAAGAAALARAANNRRAIKPKNIRPPKRKLDVPEQNNKVPRRSARLAKKKQ